MEKEKQEMRLANAQELRKQILFTQENKKQEQREKMEEGRQIQDGLNKYKNTLETIRNQKLSHIKNMGIDDKYLSELSRKKIVI